MSTNGDLGGERAPLPVDFDDGIPVAQPAAHRSPRDRLGAGLQRRRPPPRRSVPVDDSSVEVLEPQGEFSSPLVARHLSARNENLQRQVLQLTFGEGEDVDSPDDSPAVVVHVDIDAEQFERQEEDMVLLSPPEDDQERLSLVAVPVSVSDEEKDEEVVVVVESGVDEEVNVGMLELPAEEASLPLSVSDSDSEAVMRTTQRPKSQSLSRRVIRRRVYKPTDLEPGCVERILLWLPPGDLYRASQICSLFRSVGSSEKLWAPYVTRITAGMSPKDSLFPPILAEKGWRKKRRAEGGERRRLLEGSCATKTGVGRATWAFEMYQRKPWSLGLLKGSIVKHRRNQRQRSCGLWCSMFIAPIVGAVLGVAASVLGAICVSSWVKTKALLRILQCLGAALSLTSVVCVILPLCFAGWEDICGDCCAQRGIDRAREDAEEAATFMGARGRKEFAEKRRRAVMDTIRNEFSGVWKNSSSEVLLGYGSVLASIFATVAMSPIYLLGVFLGPLGLGIAPTMVIVCFLVALVFALFCCSACVAPTCLNTFRRGGLANRRIARWHVNPRMCSLIQLVPLLCVVLPWAIIVPTQLSAVLFSFEYDWGKWLPLVGLPVWTWTLILVIGSLIALLIGVLLQAHACGKCKRGDCDDQGTASYFQGMFALGILNVLVTIPYCVAVGLLAVKGSEWISMCIMGSIMVLVFVIAVCFCFTFTCYYRLWRLRLPRHLHVVSEGEDD